MERHRDRRVTGGVSLNGAQVLGVALVVALSLVAAGESWRDQGASPTATSLRLTVEGCGSFTWSDANYALSGDCGGSFDVDYRAYNASTGPITDNVTLAVGPFAEVSPSGEVEALAVAGAYAVGSVTVSQTPQEVNVTDRISENVTTAVGLNMTSGKPNGQTPVWNSSDVLGGNGSTTWSNGDTVLGSVTSTIIFHFENQSGGSTNRLEFDVSISNWPWVSSSDDLGLEVSEGAVGEPSAVHFAYSRSNDTIAQKSSNGTTLSSLTFGPSANTTGTPPQPLSLATQVALFEGSPLVGTDAYALLTFQGAGGYSGMIYDPWLMFGPVSAVAPPHYLGPPPPGGSTGNGALLSVQALLALSGVLVTGVLLGAYARRVRRRPIDEGLSSAA